MKFIKSLQNSLIKDLKYQYFSRLILITFLSITFFSVFNLYSQMNDAKDHYNIYLNSVEHAKLEGISLKEALNSPIEKETITNDDNSEIISVNNVLRYDYENVAKYIFLMKPSNTITQTLEWMSFIFFPFIFTMYGIYVATYDQKYRTIKIRAVQDNWINVLLSKQISSYIAIVLMTLFSLLLSFIIGIIFYKMLTNSIPINDFQFENIPEKNNVILQLILSMFICILYFTIGFYLGILFKGFMIPTLTFTIYNFIVPILGEFDLRNLISILGHKVFNFQGRFQLFVPTDVSLNMTWTIIISFIIVSTIVVYLISNKQNKYVI